MFLLKYEKLFLFDLILFDWVWRPSPFIPQLIFRGYLACWLDFYPSAYTLPSISLLFFCIICMYFILYIFYLQGNSRKGFGWYRISCLLHCIDYLSITNSWDDIIRTLFESSLYNNSNTCTIYTGMEYWHGL